MEQRQSKVDIQLRCVSVRCGRFGTTSTSTARWAAIQSMAPKIGCTPQTLHDWVRKTEPAQVAAATEQARIRQLERENAESRVRRWPPDSNSGVSGIPGAAQSLCRRKHPRTRNSGQTGCQLPPGIFALRSCLLAKELSHRRFMDAAAGQEERLERGSNCPLLLF
jgi:hypothetical protein